LIVTAVSFGLLGCAVKADRSARIVRLSEDSVNAAEPATRAMVNGDLVVAWVEHKTDGSDVMVRVFDPNGTLSGKPVRVNQTAGEAKSWRGDPPVIATSGNQTVYVSWTAAIPDDQGTTLYVSTSRDGGHTFEKAVKVNDDQAPASHGMHSLFADTSGHVYTAWLDERSIAGNRPPEMHHSSTNDAPEPNAELYFAESSDEGRTFSQNKRIATEACPCCKTAITAGPDGHVYVGFRHVLPGGFRHISVVPSSDNGESFGDPVVVADDGWKIDSCPVSGPSLQLVNDALEVAWFAGGEARPKGVYWTHSHDLNSLSFSQPLLVGETFAAGSPVLFDDRIIWSELNNLKIATIAEDRPASTSSVGQGAVPAMTANSQDIFIVAATGENDRSSVVMTMIPR
jgi:hypothetical protein